MEGPELGTIHNALLYHQLLLLDISLLGNGILFLGLELLGGQFLRVGKLAIFHWIGKNVMASFIIVAEKKDDTVLANQRAAILVMVG